MFHFMGRGKNRILLKQEEEEEEEQGYDYDYDDDDDYDYEKMEMKKRRVDDEIIRKGPWKQEEDQVLLNHVRHHGPREWSSIRSKGLLQRTGKSCRLRWVNKLRPNLKNGCKFSEEEQRVVIELQGRFGNKWAKIATYLPGRTDNDVKNFWSSRQKRLARILHNSAAASASGSSSSAARTKTGKIKKESPASPNLPRLLQAPMWGSSMEEESTSKAAAAAHSTSSAYVEKSEPGETLPLREVKPELVPVKPEPVCKAMIPLPVMRHPQPPELISFSPESQELLAGLEDPFNFFFGGAEDVGEELSLGPPLPGCLTGGIDDDDDFPADLFDHIDRLPSPSHW